MATGRSNNDIDGVIVFLKVIGLVCLLLAAVERARARARLNDMRLELYALEVETRGELSAHTPSENRAHRAHVEGLCQNPEYRAKLAAVRTHRREMVTSLDSCKEASTRVREARAALRAAGKQAASTASVAPAPAGGGSKATSVADASERLGAAAEAAMQCRERFERSSIMRKAATAQARQVRLTITQRAGNSGVRDTGAVRPREQAVASGIATAVAANAGSTSRVAGTATRTFLGEGRGAQPRQGGRDVGRGAGGASAAANATNGSKSSEIEMPAEYDALEEGRRLL